MTNIDRADIVPSIFIPNDKKKAANARQNSLELEQAVGDVIPSFLKDHKEFGDDDTLAEYDVVDVCCIVTNCLQQQANDLAFAQMDQQNESIGSFLKQLESAPKLQAFEMDTSHMNKSLNSLFSELSRLQKAKQEMLGTTTAKPQLV